MAMKSSPNRKIEKSHKIQNKVLITYQNDNELNSEDLLLEQQQAAVFVYEPQPEQTTYDNQQTQFSYHKQHSANKETISLDNYNSLSRHH